MFTGLVEGMGTVRSTSRGLHVGTGLAGLRVGDSLAVDGTCLTVAGLDAECARFDLPTETLGRTIAGSYRPGTNVNLERPLAAEGRFHGHFVSGHVDCVGSIRRVTGASGTGFEIAYPAEYDPLVVDRGSIAVSGISLTIVRAGKGTFTVALVPETLRRTTAAGWRPGDSVNIEFDMLGRYLARWRDLGAGEARLKEYLEKPGNSVR